jgi:peptide deformylase
MQNWNKNELFKIIVGEQTPKAGCFPIPVQVWIKENQLLLKEFLAFSFSIPTALGLAANQVSWKGNRLMYRFFSHRMGIGEDNPFEIMVDPVIVKKYGDPVTEFEGCLCWPKMTIKAQRWLKIEVTYYNLDGEQKTYFPDRVNSQIWQHEMDHLDGIEEEVIRGPIKVENKAGRNDPCPCGKKDECGKPVKFKKCCGK